MRTAKNVPINNYTVEVLCEIIKQNEANKNIEFKDKVYQFNELDLLLCIRDDYDCIYKIIDLINFVKEEEEALSTVSNESEFDSIKANDIEGLNSYLQELSFHLDNERIKTKYQYHINGKIVIPTKEQQQFTEMYLYRNGIPVNEFTYCLALRRLIVGGDIESKFDRRYLAIKVNERMKQDREEKKNNNVSSL